MYVEGEPLESLSEASVALTYGAYDVEEALLEALLLCSGSGAASDVLPEPAEQPAVARANRKVNPASGFRKLGIRMYPLSCKFRDFCLRRETKSHSKGKRLTRSPCS
ncbi:hypothetical protein GCM10022403_053450 [Streptomyces coacervatus]|uniref:Uncharacterized protein n=1 Tax=Streptomyces coacervatus TaxID=647381 RepID=A0ABP7I9U5_9ACTN